ncbi:hypothetical protein H8K90_04975 [Winogradskyella echinorum]|uniref:DUF1048 domain-containing protein n=1 Tax=Winogradskyella echinorum TaxID=538189 RepID=A0ABR6Y0D8_9FLAO|nr:hypothetical protein [Winogradskyella echinorum]MBC3845720.1 hypothetical protein [Winogradskyella echinorum]MBC5750068.1 hypothetical protein [Winogradskyella echinorum]
MSILNKEHIQFIDNYLDNSNIIFLDIRMEMVDHVASAIESEIKAGDTRDFYYIFKDYMVKNKTILLAQNRKFTSAVDKAIGRKWIINMFSKTGLLTLVLAFTIIFLLNTYFEFVNVIKHIPLFVFIAIVVLYFIYIKKKNRRYSAIERIPFYFLATYYITDFLIKFGIRNSSFFNESVVITILISSLFITLFVTLLFTAYAYKKEYDLKFNKLS